MGLKTWERYFYKEFIRNAALFLFVFYGLYVLIDYASHLSGAHYHHSKLGLKDLLIHYSAEFSLRAEILIPFALLISTIETLSKLNSNLELVALLAGGYSLKTLLRPFILMALLATFFLYLNSEFIEPKAYKQISQQSDKQLLKKSKDTASIKAKHLVLEDGSTLIFKDFDPHAQIFYEAFFIASLDDVYRMETLEPFKDPPTASYVDHFTTQNGMLSLKEYFEIFKFENMHFNKKKLLDTLQPPGELSLSFLLKEAPKDSLAQENEKAARHLSALYQKLALPWLALLAVILPAPFCVQFSRHLPTFLIFAGGIFGLVAMYLIMDAAIVLGERQVVSPALALFTPMAVFLSIGSFLYYRKVYGSI